MKLNIINTSMVTFEPRYEIHLIFIENIKDGNEFRKITKFLLTQNNLEQSLHSTILALEIINNAYLFDPSEYSKLIEYRAFFKNDIEVENTEINENELIRKINPSNIVLEHMRTEEHNCYIENFEVYYFDQLQRKFEIDIEFTEKELKLIRKKKKQQL